MTPAGTLPAAACGTGAADAWAGRHICRRLLWTPRHLLFSERTVYRWLGCGSGMSTLETFAPLDLWIRRALWPAVAWRRGAYSFCRDRQLSSPSLSSPPAYLAPVRRCNGLSVVRQDVNATWTTGAGCVRTRRLPGLRTVPQPGGNQATAFCTCCTPFTWWQRRFQDAVRTRLLRCLQRLAAAIAIISCHLLSSLRTSFAGMALNICWRGATTTWGLSLNGAGRRGGGAKKKRRPPGVRQHRSSACAVRAAACCSRRWQLPCWRCVALVVSRHGACWYRPFLSASVVRYALPARAAASCWLAQYRGFALLAHGIFARS